MSALLFCESQKTEGLIHCCLPGGLELSSMMVSQVNYE